MSHVPVACTTRTSCCMQEGVKQWSVPITPLRASTFKGCSTPSASRKITPDMQGGSSGRALLLCKARPGGAIADQLVRERCCSNT